MSAWTLTMGHRVAPIRLILEEAAMERAKATTRLTKRRRGDNEAHDEAATKLAVGRRRLC